MAGEPRLMLLHGFLSTRHVWGPLRRELDGVETIAPDLLGYGRARQHDGRPYTLEAVVEHLQTVFEREQPTHLVGHSMGGIAALALARALPDAVQGVGVIGLPIFHDRDDGVRFFRRRGPLYQGFLRTDRVAHAACVSMHCTNRLWLPLAPLVLRQPRDVLRTTFQHRGSSHSGSLREIVFAGLVEKLAADVRLPVFALHGTRDRAAPFDRAHDLAALRGWNFQSVEGAGHQIQIDRPQLVAKWIHEWARPSPQPILGTSNAPRSRPVHVG